MPTTKSIACTCAVYGGLIGVGVAVWLAVVLAFHRSIHCPTVYCNGPRDRTVGTIIWITSPRLISVEFNDTSGVQLQQHLSCPHGECANYALYTPITVYYHHCYGERRPTFGITPEHGPSVWCVLAWSMLFTLLLLTYNYIAEYVIAPRLLFVEEEEESVEMWPVEVVHT